MYFVLIGVGVSCGILYSIVSYLFVSFSGLITSVVERERERFFLLSFFLVLWFLFGFLFLLMLGIGCVIFL